MRVRSFFSNFLLLHGDKLFWTIEEALPDQTACLEENGILNYIPDLYQYIKPASSFLGSQIRVKVDLGIRSPGARTKLNRVTQNVIFVQIVGVNYLRVYDSDESFKLYLYRSRGLYKASEDTCSPVCCEDEDFDLHPLAKDASYRETYLFPGDALFIPFNTFLYIRSICTSIHFSYKW
jgi:hypothetical protein